MRKVITVLLLLATASFLFAADDNNVTYTGGTAPQVKEGSTGRFDFSAAGQLQFVSAGTVLEIPYNSIESFEHSKEAAVHLGVAPAIAVGLIAARRHNHFVRITYRDTNQLPQVAVFEVPKAMTAYLMPMLGARSPQAQCSPYQDCPPRSLQPRPPAHTTQPAAAK
jgi:hypothetical protein